MCGNDSPQAATTGLMTCWLYSKGVRRLRGVLLRAVAGEIR